MLEELTIRNYALIDLISITFHPGFNVLSGETGAGKSIIVGSLSLLLGAKADAGIIRSGCDETSVSAVISIDKNNDTALEWLKNRDINCEDGTIIVRRTIRASGRGSIFIQQVPVTRADLESFMSLLFDLHGQHDHESLLHKESHRIFLDRFAGIEADVISYNKRFIELAEKRKTLELSFNTQKEREAKLELLRFAVDEINEAALRGGELQELENEAKMLSSFEKLASFVNSAADYLYNGEESALSLSRRAKNALDNACAVDPSLASLYKRIEELYFEAEDISGEFRSYKDALSFDPQRQEIIDSRLAVIYKLKRKYLNSNSSNTEEDIIAYRANAESEIEKLTNIDENRDKLKTEIAALEKDIFSKAAVLRQKRADAAVKLAETVTSILKKLGMPNASFLPKLNPKKKEDGSQSMVCGPWGCEDIEFLISANTGEPLKDLSRIASGGELSRIMLAIKSVFSAGQKSKLDSVETLVFDEIDAGIGGEAALAVAEHLVKIGEYKQIFCVTHLASIAVSARNHFKVEKFTKEGRTFALVEHLSHEGRRSEIARMLAGANTDIALVHADELILKYSKRD